MRAPIPVSACMRLLAGMRERAWCYSKRYVHAPTQPPTNKPRRAWNIKINSPFFVPFVISILDAAHSSKNQSRPAPVCMMSAAHQPKLYANRPPFSVFSKKMSSSLAALLSTARYYEKAVCEKHKNQCSERNFKFT
jgi:hypothetical protein